MSIFPKDAMKPVLILPEGTMRPEDMKKLNDNGICTVEAKNPALVKFLDPIPSAAQRGKIEDTAIQFSRRMLDRDTFIRQGSWTNLSRADVTSIFVELLVKGSILDNKPSQEEQEQSYFNQEKLFELQRLAREEAREGRKQAKEEKAQENGKTKQAEKAK